MSARERRPPRRDSGTLGAVMTDDVLAANARFYEVFARGDARAMDELWSEDAAVACVHPGWRALVGRVAVMNSWRRLLAGGATPIACEDPLVISESATAAVVLCVERLGDSELSATNVFVRERGQWRLVHHHAGPVAARPSAPRILN